MPRRGRAKKAAQARPLLGEECSARVVESTSSCEHASSPSFGAAAVRAKVLSPSRWCCRECADAAATRRGGGGCDERDDVWACLACGHVGCGAEAKNHARTHAAAKRHPVAMDVVSKRCFCFVCNRFVLDGPDAGGNKAVAELRRELALCQEEAARASSASSTEAEDSSDEERSKRQKKQRTMATTSTTAATVEEEEGPVDDDNNEEEEEEASSDESEREQEVLAPPERKKACILRSRSVWKLTRDQFVHEDRRATAVKHEEHRCMAHAFSVWRSALRNKADAQHKPAEAAAEGESAPQRVLRRAKTRQLVPGRTGLRNLGNTCFMNSILQAVSAIPEFRDYFLRMEWVNQKQQPLRIEAKPPTKARPATEVTAVITRRQTMDCLTAVRQRGRAKDDKEPISVCMQLHELLRVLWSGRWAVVTPFALLESVWRLVPRFRGYQQQDAQEFLCSLFDRVHSEIAAPPPPSLPPSAASSRSDSPSPSSPQKSVVSGIFQGVLASRVTCSRCSHSSETAEEFLDLSINIPVPEVSKPRQQQQPQKQQQQASAKRKPGRPRKSETVGAAVAAAPANAPKQPVALEECLRSFTAPEWLEGGEFTCERCKRKVRAKKQLFVRSPPRVLCLVLKRFSWTARGVCAKVLVPVDFPLRLDIAPFCSLPAGFAFADGSNMYELRAVVCHHGTKLISGHYTAYCLDDGGGNGSANLSSWVHFNDSFVSPVDESDMVADAKQAGYIFFYQCMTPADASGGSADNAALLAAVAKKSEEVMAAAAAAEVATEDEEDEEMKTRRPMSSRRRKPLEDEDGDEEPALPRREGLRQRTTSQQKKRGRPSSAEKLWHGKKRQKS